MGSVGPARGEGAAEDADAGGGGLDRVVAAREQVLVADRGDVAAAAAELRLPERVEVRLVADDHVTHGRERLYHRGAEGGEIGPRGGRRRRRPGEAVPD